MQNADFRMQNYRQRQTVGVDETYKVTGVKKQQAWENKMRAVRPASDGEIETLGVAAAGPTAAAAF